MKARMAAANSARKMRRMSMKNCKTKRKNGERETERETKDELRRECQRKCTSVTKIHTPPVPVSLTINYA